LRIGVIMVAPSDFQFTFRDVFIQSRDRVILVAGDDEYDKQDAKVSWVLRWKSQWDSQPLRIRATSIAVVNKPTPAAFMLGIEGVVARWSSPEIEYDIIDNSINGPQYIGDLREIRVVFSKVFVVGMGRTVYRYDGPSRWVRVDQGVREKTHSEDIVGFNSIDGFSESNLVAVGWHGEIWVMTGSNWTQIDSPTNATLNKVLCLPNKVSFACGQRGSLLVDKGDGWRLVEQEVTRDDFWGMAWFKNALYLSTLNNLYKWDADGLKLINVQPADKSNLLELAPNVSFFRLHSDSEVIWSVGAKTALYSYDGVLWQETQYR
jgi:hypothetical protein